MRLILKIIKIKRSEKVFKKIINNESHMKYYQYMINHKKVSLFCKNSQKRL